MENKRNKILGTILIIFVIASIIVLTAYVCINNFFNKPQKELAVIDSKEYEWCTCKALEDGTVMITPNNAFDINKDYAFLGGHSLNTAVIPVRYVFAGSDDYDYPTSLLADILSCALLSEDQTKLNEENETNSALLAGLFGMLVYELPENSSLQSYSLTTEDDIVLVLNNGKKDFKVEILPEKNKVLLNGSKWDIPIFDKDEVGLWATFMISAKDGYKKTDYEDFLRKLQTQTEEN